SGGAGAPRCRSRSRTGPPRSASRPSRPASAAATSARATRSPTCAETGAEGAAWRPPRFVPGRTRRSGRQRRPRVAVAPRRDGALEERAAAARRAACGLGVEPAVRAVLVRIRRVVHVAECLADLEVLLGEGVVALALRGDDVAVGRGRGAVGRRLGRLLPAPAGREGGHAE